MCTASGHERVLRARKTGWAGLFCRRILAQRLTGSPCLMRGGGSVGEEGFVSHPSVNQFSSRTVCVRGRRATRALANLNRYYSISVCGDWTLALSHLGMLLAWTFWFDAAELDNRMPRTLSH